MGLLQGESLDRALLPPPRRLAARPHHLRHRRRRRLAATLRRHGRHATAEPTREQPAHRRLGQRTPSPSNLHFWTMREARKRTARRSSRIDPRKTAPPQQVPTGTSRLRPAPTRALALGLMHVHRPDDWPTHDYIERYTARLADELRERVLRVAAERVADLCGITADDRAAWPASTAPRSPAAIRVNYGLQRARGGGDGGADDRAACPAVVGAWRHARRRVAAVEFGLRTRSTDAALQRPDLLPGAGTRTINMVTTRRRLLRETRVGPPVEALFVYNSTRRRCPDQSRGCEGLRARTCSPWSANSSRPTPPTTPTSCCPPRRSSSTSTCT